MERKNNVQYIKDLFKTENLCFQPVYKAKESYNVVYINPSLYEEIFNEKYAWETASKKIAEMFSITLDKDKSNGEIIEDVFSDKQQDPWGIALSGNLGSGRAYFYKNIFNIKGDKTNLATSPNAIYNNGKYALSAAIKETVISNILSSDFIIPTFSTLAILETKERFDFVDQYLDEDDVIREKTYNLPCAIEIRVNKYKELYRISNSLINSEVYNKEKIQYLCELLAKIEASKFCDRFLHGSWSVGNVSTEGNLIDFDTASFVKGRYPQYSNTNKYKSNYFGYELLGQELMIESIVSDETDFGSLMENKYEENMRLKLSELIGIDYKKYSNFIDSLCEKFNVLSRKFLPNYYETSVFEEYGEHTYIFDFSRFFQKYLIERKNNKLDMLLGLRLLLNDTKTISYNKVGMIKEKVDEFFYKDLVNENDIDNLIDQAMDFIEEYDGLLNEIVLNEDLTQIKLNQYIVNADRNYLYGNKNVYGYISHLYEVGKIDSVTLNRIINALIKTNIRNRIYKENLLGLKLYKDFLTYFVVSSDYYYLVLEKYTDFAVDFAKFIINGKELMVSHISDDVMVSEKVHFDDFESFLEFDVVIKINGKEYTKKLTESDFCGIIVM